MSKPRKSVEEQLPRDAALKLFAEYAGSDAATFATLSKKFNASVHAVQAVLRGQAYPDLPVPSKIKEAALERLRRRGGGPKAKSKGKARPDPMAARAGALATFTAATLDYLAARKACRAAGINDDTLDLLAEALAEK